MDNVSEPPVDAAEVTRSFLLTLFETDAQTDVQKTRYDKAIIGVRNLEFDMPLDTLQVIIGAIFHHFVAKSQEGMKQDSSRRRYSFIEAAANCREEDAIDFIFFSYAKCDEELKNDTLSDQSKIYIETTKKAVLYTFTMLLRGYLYNGLSPQRAFFVFVKRLLEYTIPETFLRALVEFLINPKSVRLVDVGDVFNPIFDILRSGFLAQQFERNNDGIAKEILSVMRTLLDTQLVENGPRPLCEVLASRADFLLTSSNPMNGREFASKSFLGPFFAYGLESSPQHPNTRVFKNMESDAQKSDSSMNTAQKQFCKRIFAIRCALCHLLHPIALNPSTTDNLFAWMAKIIDSNHKRSQLQHESEEVVGDHFMTNFLTVLYSFTDLVDLSKIVLEYPFLPCSRINISNETRIRMSELMAEEFELKYADRPVLYHFSTISFFLTIAAQKLVFPPLILQIKEVTRRITELRTNLGNALKEINRATTLHEIGQLEEKWKPEREKWEAMCRHLLCVKTQIQDPVLQKYAFEFATKQLKIVMKTANPDLTDFGDESQYPAEPTEMFCAYPEHYLKDVLDIFTYCLHSASSEILECSPDWINLCTVLFTHFNYTYNPFIVFKLVALLANLSTPLWENLMNLNISPQRLLMAMIKIYLDSDFDEDFDEIYIIRGNIQQILRKTCKNSNFNEVFIDMARECGDEFIQFVNVTINDASWCIDKSFSGLRRVHEIETEMEEAQEWAATNQRIRNLFLVELILAEKKVKKWLGTANSNQNFLIFLTQTSTEPFRTSVLGEQLATMLNHNLNQLLGDNRHEVSVKNPESYGWQPREFIKVLISIYLGLNVPAFIKYIAYDERNYTPVFFNNVISRLKLVNILSTSEMKKFEDLTKDVKIQHDLKISLEEDYDSVPEEFKDAIMDTIMKDPVTLPSGQIMDRAVIERHLLSTPNNPFTRASLTKEELVPVVELKAKIEEWKIQKMNSKK